MCGETGVIPAAIPSRFPDKMSADYQLECQVFSHRISEGEGGGLICGDIRSLFQPAFPLAGGPRRAGSGERWQFGSDISGEYIIED
jgi:hypothetical protein